MSEATPSTLIEKNEAGVCRRVLDDASNNVFAVEPSTDVIDGLLTVLRERDDSPSIRILAEEPVLKEIVSDFTTTSIIADFVAHEVLSLRTTNDRLNGPLLLTEDTAVLILRTESRVLGLVTDDNEFVEIARNRYESLWDDAETFRLRTPPLSQVQETLEDKFGPELRTDFDRMRTALSTTENELDIVDICLFAAAKNDVLLYDISTWSENIGIASRATFSRKKASLEERGLIETEKVPVDVDQPRQRLVLGDECLHEADADELVSVAWNIFSVVG